jgi:hypothetical protein
MVDFSLSRHKKEKESHAEIAESRRVKSIISHVEKSVEKKYLTRRLESTKFLLDIQGVARPTCLVGCRRYKKDNLHRSIYNKR